MNHLRAISEMKKAEIEEILDLASKIKKEPSEYSSSLKGKNLVMIFQKTSTRTRISFEIGMAQLGGHATFLDWKDSNFQVGDLFDEVKCIGGYADMIMARVFIHKDVEKMAKVAGIPVINGLSDFEHPCQALADLMTIKENSGFDAKIAFVGDGNNVCNSLIAACTKLGIKIAVATPRGFEPDSNLVKEAQSKGTLTLTTDPQEAVKGADFVYTDTWVSLGQETQTDERLKVFPPYQLNSALLPDGAYAMHCLPAHRGYEITDEIMDSPKFLGFAQSENRLHVQKAAMIKLLGRFD